MSSDHPRLSVVIPTHNRPLLLERAVRSVLAQDGHNVEIVVVDDASDTPARLALDLFGHRVQVLRNPTNAGVAVSRNRGIEAAGGRYVAFLDDDDVWRPGFAAAILSALEAASSEPAFCWCSIDNVDHAPDGSVAGIRPRLFRAAGSPQEMVSAALSIGTSWGLTVERACFALAGVFDPSFKLIEDTEFILRLLDAGCAPKVVSEPLVEIHHYTDASRPTHATRNRERVGEIDRMLAAYSTFFARHPHTAAGLRTYSAELLRAAS